MTIYWELKLGGEFIGVYALDIEDPYAASAYLKSKGVIHDCVHRIREGQMLLHDAHYAELDSISIRDALARVDNAIEDNDRELALTEIARMEALIGDLKKILRKEWEGLAIKH